MFGQLLTPTHLIFVLVIGLLLFGTKRLPDVARGLGKGFKEFKEGVTGSEEESSPKGD